MKHLFEFNIFDNLKEDQQLVFIEKLLECGWRHMTKNDIMGYAGVCSDFPLIYSGEIGDAIYEFEGCNTANGKPTFSYMIHSSEDFSIDETGDDANRLALQVVEFDKKLKENLPKDIMQKIKDMKRVLKHERYEVNYIIKNIVKKHL